MTLNEIKNLKEMGIKLETIPHKKIILKLLQEFIEKSNRDDLPDFEEVSKLNIKIGNSTRPRYIRRTGQTIVYKQVKLILTPPSGDQLIKTFLNNQVKFPETTITSAGKATIMQIMERYSGKNYSFVLDILNWYMFKLFKHYMKNDNHFFYVYINSWLTEGRIEILFQFEINKDLILSFNDNLHTLLFELGFKKNKIKKIKKRTINLPENTEVKTTKYFTMITAKYKNKFKEGDKDGINENSVEENS